MLYTIQNEFLKATVSLYGAELQSLIAADGTEFLWQGDPAYWNERSPILFPYIGRMTNKSFYLDGELHHMQNHGIVKYHDFRLVSATDTQLVLTFEDTQEVYADYPRHFLFQVTYTLNGNTLDVACRVENRDDKTMYFGLGGHPGFLLPFTPGKAFTDYQLRFPAPCQPRRVVFSETCFCTGDLVPYTLQDGTTIPLQHSLFDDDAIVLADTPKEVTLSAAGDSRSVTVTFPDMDYIGFWQFASNDTPFLCIEPWSSLPSPDGKITVLEEQKDLLSLPGGDCYENVWSIRVDL
jgi:galactose mutarotase-like enzyme